YFAACITALMNFMPFGVPKPVTLSQPAPVVSEESVPNVSTSHLVDDGLLYRALTYRVTGPGAASASGLSNTGGLGGLLITPKTFSSVSIGFTFTSVIALLLS